MKIVHGRTRNKTKVYIYLYISLYENVSENGFRYIYIYIYIYMYIYKYIYIYIYIYITDDEQINCRFDLAFYYYLVSYYTTCVQHSSDKIAKCEFTSLH